MCSTRAMPRSMRCAQPPSPTCLHASHSLKLSGRRPPRLDARACARAWVSERASERDDGGIRGERRLSERAQATAPKLALWLRRPHWIVLSPMSRCPFALSGWNRYFALALLHSIRSPLCRVMKTEHCSGTPMNLCGFQAKESVSSMLSSNALTCSASGGNRQYGPSAGTTHKSSEQLKGLTASREHAC